MTADVDLSHKIAAAPPSAPDDVDRLVRELDVALNGPEGAAPQASLCDLVCQVQRIVRERGAPLLAPSATVGVGGFDKRFAEMLLGILSDVQDELGFTDEDKLCANGSAEIVAEIRELKRVAALAQQPSAVDEAGAFDANFLRSVASLCRAAFDLCEPKPQRTPEDPREHYGELCLLELTSIADEIERRLAAENPPAAPSVEAVAWLRMKPDGTPDWAEDCIGSDDKFLDPEMASDGYYLQPLYTAPQHPEPLGDERDARLALSEAEQVCAQAYQVVGSLLDDLGQFDSEMGNKILDNLAEARLVHEDVLPWPGFAPTIAPLQAEVERQRGEVEALRYDAGTSASVAGTLMAENAALRAKVERLNRLLGRIVEGDCDSTLTIRAGADAFAAAREYLAAPKPQAVEIEALQAEIEQLRAEVEDYRTNGAAAVRFAPSSAYWSNELRRLFGDDARTGIEVLENRHRQELARAERLAEALREIRRDALDGCSAMDCARNAFDVLNELGLLRDQEEGHE